MNLLNNKPVLVILCKRPRPGVGKQRLAESIGYDPAYRIAVALLDCALEDACRWQGCVVISPADTADRGWAEALAAKHGITDYRVIVQSTGNLGERINQLDRQLRAEGNQQLLFMGTDAPLLTNVHFQQARLGLAESDIVLSHASDGGLVLMGNAVPWPEMKKLAWSTAQLGDQVSQECHQQQYRIHNIISGYDIDIEEDLGQARIDLATDCRPAREQLLAVINSIKLA